MTYENYTDATPEVLEALVDKEVEIFFSGLDDVAGNPLRGKVVRSDLPLIALHEVPGYRVEISIEGSAYPYPVAIFTSDTIREAPTAVGA